ncbi:MAG: single-stranded DNA-binding protein [Saprospiraceae bacterium]|nr:single-stranded DNA-binding protein [Saprospiraceae bacterium]
MLNKVCLIGNLGKDPEFRTLESGATKANFSLATNESYKDRNGNWQKATEWHDIVLWRSMAERAKSLKKGMLVYLEGKLTHRKWTDKEGRDHYTTEVVGDLLRILEKRDSATTYSGPPSSVEDKKPEDAALETMEHTEDDLPF